MFESTAGLFISYLNSYNYLIKMAKLVKNHFFQFTGKIGEYVGCNGPYGYYIRKAPRKSTKPASPLQLLSRAKFKLATEVMSPLRNLYKPNPCTLWTNNIRLFNKMLGYCIRYMVKGTYPDLYVDMRGLKLSEGALLAVDVATFRQSGPMEAEVTWNERDWPRTSPCDHVMVVLYNERAGVFSYNSSMRRADGSCKVYQELMQAGDVHAYLYCISENGKVFSESIYLGQLTCN